MYRRVWEALVQRTKDRTRSKKSQVLFWPSSTCKLCSTRHHTQMAGSYYVNQERWLGSEVLTGSVVAGPKGSASLVCCKWKFCWIGNSEYEPTICILTSPPGALELNLRPTGWSVKSPSMWTFYDDLEILICHKILYISISTAFFSFQTIPLTI